MFAHYLFGPLDLAWGGVPGFLIKTMCQEPSFALLETQDPDFGVYLEFIDLPASATQFPEPVFIEDPADVRNCLKGFRKLCLVRPL